MKKTRGYNYYITPLGRRVVALGLRLKELVIRPELSKQEAA